MNAPRGDERPLRRTDRIYSRTTAADEHGNPLDVLTAAGGGQTAIRVGDGPWAFFDRHSGDNFAHHFLFAMNVGQGAPVVLHSPEDGY